MLAKIAHRNEAFILEEFRDDVNRVMSLLEHNEEEARLLFVSTTYPKYSEAVVDATSPLRSFFFFFQELDEYLNSPGARALGHASKEILVRSHADFLIEVAKAIEK